MTTVTKEVRQEKVVTDKTSVVTKTKENRRDVDSLQCKWCKQQQADLMKPIDQPNEEPVGNTHTPYLFVFWSNAENDRFMAQAGPLAELLNDVEHEE